MTDLEYEKYKGTAPVATDELTALPSHVMEKLEAHRLQYLSDPENAHYWDPIIIGVPGGPVPCLLLEYKGRKSGKDMSIAIQYFRLDGKIAIVASKGGIDKHPAWFLNLEAHPECHIRVAGNQSDAIARVVTGEERAKWWKLIEKEQPMQIIYQERTSREIPVVVLEVPEGTVI